jgi:two-component system sensor histidine kinase VicK
MSKKPMVYYKKNMLDTAEALLIESINVNLQPYGDHKDAQLEQVQLADLYLKKNELTLLHQTLLALGNEFKKEVAEQAKMAWLMQMSQYYEKTHDGENSIKYFRNYISMRDSVNEVNKLAFTTDILQQLKDKDQQIQIDKLKRANQLSYMYLWITIALALMALTIILLVYNYYRKGKHNIQELMMLNNEVGKQKNKLEFAMVELEKSNSGKDRILNAVAHDLRNPIGGIAMLCTSLIADNKHDEESGALLNMIEKTALDSLNLINELLDSNVPQDNIHLHKHMVDINDLATQCLLLMRLSADKKYQELRLSPLPQSLSVNIDKEKIERVLNNLLSNAIKFSQEGGEINLKLEQKNNAVYIIIKDQGMGIAPEVHSELFNTLTGIRRKGTAGEKSFGLGLSICKQIVEAHNGRIWLDSELGKGATFYVELPL